jgi:hypothetical protein
MLLPPLPPSLLQFTSLVMGRVGAKSPRKPDAAGSYGAAQSPGSKAAAK